MSVQKATTEASRPEPRPVLHRVTKIDAAVHQLDWAIRLLVEFDEPMPAITLAGAAGDILRKVSKSPIYDQLAEKFAESHGVDRRKFGADHANRLRNWLKHWDIGNEPESEEFDLQTDAILHIARSLSDLATYDGSTCAQAQAFQDWLVVARPDLRSSTK